MNNHDHRDNTTAPGKTGGGGWMPIAMVTLAFGVVWSMSMLDEAMGRHPAQAAMAVILAAGTSLPYAGVLLWLDRYEVEPWPLLGFAFLWGAAAATTAAMVGNGIFLAIVSQWAPHPQALAFTTIVGAPFIEEGCKGAAVGLIFLAFAHDFDNILDGVIYGAFAGLGFAFFENLMFYVSEPPSQMLSLTWGRGVLTGLTGHPTFTALTGIGFGVVRVMRRGRARWLAVPAGFATAVIAHGLWNNYAVHAVHQAVPSPDLYLHQLPAAVAAIQLPFAALVLMVTAMSWRQEEVVILTWLEDEVAVPRVEVLRLVPHWRRTTRNLCLWWTDGWRAYRASVHRDHALIRLAFAKWHYHHDGRRHPLNEDQAVTHARARILALDNGRL